MKINIEDKIRFEKKIEKSANGCWIWTGSKNSKGYGRVRIDKKEYMAHRISYNIYLGEIPYGLFICHKCDNPSCVNPEHLFTGTARDNTQDMLSKNRRIYTKEYRKNLSIAHLGKTLSEEHKAKIAESITGRECSDETKEILRAKSAGNTNALGYTFSDEAKATRSKSMIGNTNGKGSVRSPESRERYRQAALRRVMSAETKAKISASGKGNKNALGHSLSDSAKARISEANKGNTNTLGKTLSEEHKAKISASLMGNTINLGRKQDPEIVAKRIAKTHETMRINKLNNNLTI